MCYLPPLKSRIVTFLRWHGNSIALQRHMQHSNSNNVRLMRQAQVAVVTVAQQRPRCRRNRSLSRAAPINPVVQRLQEMNEVLQRNHGRYSNRHWNGFSFTMYLVFLT